ncbi:MAG: hypothetical protein JSV16_00940 [Candidatus Hydrogenedentota bacterium]|nr:MAG: hypothetical protein JSV16_00940 [Candidatus Hydrogenedentota bacterium]
MKTRLVISVLILAVLTFAAKDRNEGDAGDGFFYRNVSFEPPKYERNTPTMRGEMSNEGDRYYELVLFDVTLYDDEDNVIAVATFPISNFDKGTTRPFKKNVDVQADEIHSYKIDYSTGY